MSSQPRNTLSSCCKRSSGYNDFHIFNAVGKKVAVANAVPELKALADEVIDDVTSDPVTRYLNRYKAK
jgi:hydroxymethylpyrimidine pyrophosphatase-like HAD family hydrolase